MIKIKRRKYKGNFLKGENRIRMAGVEDSNKMLKLRMSSKKKTIKSLKK